ncbi:hypothetical protein BKA70DRAFT_1218696 [Coprinopsis sp. MPI-PUGE-AT-0042]|nr:hypothetical protein BKA70DRAFT_1218696 [Coprinopsis sp. MPI-PUGE-AT-0042]
MSEYYHVGHAAQRNIPSLCPCQQHLNRLSLAQPVSSEAFKKAEALLRIDRDILRSQLFDAGGVMHGKLTDFQPLLVCYMYCCPVSHAQLWITTIVLAMDLKFKDANSHLNYRPHGYFEVLYVQAKQCPGSHFSDNSAGSIHAQPHALITSTPWRTISPFLPSTEASLAKYENKVELWFKATLGTVPKNDWTASLGCWWVHDGVRCCSGEPVETPHPITYELPTTIRQLACYSTITDVQLSRQRRKLRPSATCRPAGPGNHDSRVGPSRIGPSVMVGRTPPEWARTMRAITTRLNRSFGIGGPSGEADSRIIWHS